MTIRILFLGNNHLGLRVLTWLKERDEDIVGVVVHPAHKAKYRDEMIQRAGTDAVFDGATLRDPDVLQHIRELKTDIALSILFGYIVRAPFIELFPSGVVNLHPSYLPYNRGAYPNVWSIVEQTPAGATLHYIDTGVDTGGIIAQRQVAVEPVDTGQSLYHKLEEASFSLFVENWPAIKAGTAQSVSQSTDAGTEHRVKDVENLDEIHLDQQYTGRELINILRARTFPPYNGAYFYDNGRKVYMRMDLYYEDED